MRALTYRQSTRKIEALGRAWNAAYLLKRHIMRDCEFSPANGKRCRELEGELSDIEHEAARHGIADAVIAFADSLRPEVTI